MRFRDLTGQKFGMLTVLERLDKISPVTWVCECSCGNKHNVRIGNLTTGSVRSCGECRPKMEKGFGSNRYKESRIANLCGCCRVNLSILGKTSCERCKTKIEKLRKERRSKGYCAYCDSPVISGHSRCQKHFDSHTTGEKRRMVDLDKEHLCRLCSNPVLANSRKYCPVCILNVKERHKQWYMSLKLQVIAGYGGRCQCPGCDVAIPEFLTLDHINNDGAFRRKMLGTKEIGANLYQRLIKEQFPKGTYQLLCFNCNLSKGFFGKCPHTEQTNCMVAAGGA